MLLLDIFSLRSEVGQNRRIRIGNTSPGLMRAFVDIMGHDVEDMEMVVRIRRQRGGGFL
jgi:hypothetical protein